MGSVRNVGTSEAVSGLSQPVARDEKKDEALPPQVKTTVNNAVKSSSLLGQLQNKMKQGKLGPKTSGDKG